MQDNPNQTNQKDPDNGGLDDNWDIPEAIRLLWCANADVKITSPGDIDDDIEAIRELLADADKKELPK